MAFQRTARACVMPLLLAVSAAAHAQAARGAAEEYSLANVLRSAHEGDTIIVPSGWHRGLFIIDRRMTVRGAPGAILDGEGKGTVVTVRADSVVLSTLRVTGSGMSLDRDEAAVRIEWCSGCVAEGLTIDRPLHGIYLAETNGVRVANNIITGDSTVPEARRGNGIHLFNTKLTRVTKNEVRSTRDGIYFSFASETLVDSNTITGVRYGLHYMYSNDNTFVANAISRNAAGAAIMFSDRIVLRDNVFADHLGYRAYGLLLQTTSDVLAEGNKFRGNLIGLFIDNSQRATIRDNEITENGIGIDLLPSAHDNTLVGNWIVRNRIPVRISRGNGRSTWSVDGRGNYWDVSSVFDLNGDGVGDKPLRVGDAFATLSQSRPALELFAGTPAARALSWAEEALPAFTTLRVVDPAPLIASASAFAGRKGLLLPALVSMTMLLLTAVALTHGLWSRRDSTQRRAI